MIPYSILKISNMYAFNLQLRKLDGASMNANTNQNGKNNSTGWKDLQINQKWHFASCAGMFWNLVIMVYSNTNKRYVINSQYF